MTKQVTETSRLVTGSRIPQESGRSALTPAQREIIDDWARHIPQETTLNAGEAMMKWRIDITVRDGEDVYAMPYYVRAIGPELAREEALDLLRAEHADFLVRNPTATSMDVVSSVVSFISL